MAEAAEKRWTVEEFFRWQERQPDRYELVGGFPVRLMAGTRNAHDDVTVNLIAALVGRLRGSGCRPFTGDGSVETYPGQIRRPDVGVDCGSRDPNGFKAAEPRLVAEVLSPSTRDFDSIAKLEEYKSVGSIHVVLLIEPNAPEVFVWSREADGSWRMDIVEGRDAVLPLPTLAIEVPLAELYEGVAFPDRPRLRLLERP